MIQKHEECEVGVPNSSKNCFQYANLENFSMRFPKKWISRVAMGISVTLLGFLDLYRLARLGPGLSSLH